MTEQSSHLLRKIFEGRRIIIWAGFLALAVVTVSEVLTLLDEGFSQATAADLRGVAFGVLLCAVLILANWLVSASLGAYLAILIFGFNDAEQFLWLIVSLVIFSALAGSAESSLVRNAYLAFVAMWMLQFAIRAQDDVISLVVQIPAVVLAFVTARAMYVLREKNQQSLHQMAELRDRTESAIRDERKNIARDLHDIVAHDITIVAMQSKAAKFANDESTSREAIDVISKLSSETLHDLRLMLNVLRTDGTMSDIGASSDGKPSATTIQAIQGIAVFSQRLRDAGFDVETDVDEQEITELPRSAHTALYRVMQEATTNIIKHAEPGSQCSISLKRRGDTAVLRMVNQVMTSKKIATNDALWGGSGLIGMEDRMRAFGGQFEAGKHAHQWILVAEIPF